MSKYLKNPVREHGESTLAPLTWPGLLRPLSGEKLEQMLREMWPPAWAPLRVPVVPDFPAVDVYEEGDAVVLKAELPGLKKEDIEVEVEDNVVTISGRREKEEKVEKKDYYRYERSTGEFSRSVVLPVEIDAAKVTAKIESGVLEVKAPRKEGAERKATKIPVS